MTGSAEEAARSSGSAEEGARTSGSLLTVEGITVGYTDVDVLHDVSIEVGAGEFVCIIGPNGAGKSTLIKAVAGLLSPRDGTVNFDGADITGQRPHRITEAGLGYVPQLDNIFPNLTVEENLEIGAFPVSGPLAPHLERVYELFGVLLERRRSRAATLSGGERQMLALGRALMAGPKLLALDEPSAGLAPMVVEEIFTLIADVNAAGVAVLLVEQSARKALSMSDRGYVLDLGRNRFEGPGPDLLEDQKVVDLYLGGASRIDIPQE